MTGGKSNLPASVAARLLNLAKGGGDDYQTLLQHASDAVRTCWRLYEWRRRQEHDPVWLGVQVTDTYDELAGEVTVDD